MASADRVDEYLRKSRIWIAVACCLIGGLRVLIFAAGFPLFNAVDETSHYEMVYQYSRGVRPGPQLFKMDPEMARIFSLYATDEYLIAKDVLRRHNRDVPLPALPADVRDFLFPRRMSFSLPQSNIETQSPPVYYLVAAAWYRLGEVFGLRDWKIAYWTRFLNAILYGAFVWVAYLFVRRVYPERMFLCLGVPLLLAVFPQDVFYGMNRDALSPLLGALVLWLLADAAHTENVSARVLIAAGVLTGLAFLTDVSNFVLFGALLAVLVTRSRKAQRTGDPGKEQGLLAVSLVAAAALPLVWMIRNRVVMGDFSAIHEKTFYLGWVMKPWNELLHHLLFTPSGAWYFVRELIGSFWRGEYV